MSKEEHRTRAICSAVLSMVTKMIPLAAREFFQEVMDHDTTYLCTTAEQIECATKYGLRIVGAHQHVGRVYFNANECPLQLEHLLRIFFLKPLLDNLLTSTEVVSALDRARTLATIVGEVVSDVEGGGVSMAYTTGGACCDAKLSIGYEVLATNLFDTEYTKEGTVTRLLELGQNKGQPGSSFFKNKVVQSVDMVNRTGGAFLLLLDSQKKRATLQELLKRFGKSDLFGVGQSEIEVLCLKEFWKDDKIETEIEDGDITFVAPNVAAVVVNLNLKKKDARPLTPAQAKEVYNFVLDAHKHLIEADDDFEEKAAIEQLKQAVEATQLPTLTVIQMQGSLNGVKTTVKTVGRDLAHLKTTHKKIVSTKKLIETKELQVGKGKLTAKELATTPTLAPQPLDVRQLKTIVVHWVADVSHCGSLPLKMLQLYGYLNELKRVDPSSIDLRANAVTIWEAVTSTVKNVKWTGVLKSHILNALLVGKTLAKEGRVVRLLPYLKTMVSDCCHCRWWMVVVFVVVVLLR